MKKIYLYLFLMAIAVSCEKDELVPQQSENNAPENQPYLEEIDFKDLPSNILYFLDKKELDKARGAQTFPLEEFEGTWQQKRLSTRKVV